MDVLELTKQLVSMPSVSKDSNVAVNKVLEDILSEAGFEIERNEYTDESGVLKANFVAKIGPGTGGLAFCSHSDTVPGQEDQWPAFDPFEQDGSLFGRGTCDMKGPLAATVIAATQIDATKLKKPVYIVVTADEEVGLIGAKFLSEVSDMLKNDRPEHAIIAEPTSMIPVYAHKGFALVTVTANGRAAHTSTGLGESATIKMAPFMADMAQLDVEMKANPIYQNDDFIPPTNGFNMTINDYATPFNVTASKTTVNMSFRTMPNTDTEGILEKMEERAQSYGLDFAADLVEPLYCPPSAEIVQAALELTDKDKAETVPYGTDGTYLQNVIKNLVILGPGDISVAHTIEEHVPLSELYQAVDVYKGLIETLCT
ncbi:MAG: M20/M25/M40 family metallo-hydrolase [Chloroflexota bacterium]